jgi:hypothetical protein
MRLTMTLRRIIYFDALFTLMVCLCPWRGFPFAPDGTPYSSLFIEVFPNSGFSLLRDADECRLLPHF